MSTVGGYDRNHLMLAALCVLKLVCVCCNEILGTLSGIPEIL